MKSRDVELSIIYEQVILQEYSEGLINQQVQRLASQAGAVDPKLIKQYVQRFDQLKTGNARDKFLAVVNKNIEMRRIAPKNNPLEINSYSWEELQELMDSFSLIYPSRAGRKENLRQMRAFARDFTNLSRKYY